MISVDYDARGDFVQCSCPDLGSLLMLTSFSALITHSASRRSGRPSILNGMQFACVIWSAAMVGIGHGNRLTASDDASITFRDTAGQVVITAGDQAIATYFYADQEITRPFFAHVHAPSGVQVTRNHPPVAGKDPVDHGTFHPGIWLAFGDIGGQDVWRNKAVVRHDKFLEKTISKDGSGSFTVLNSYRREDDSDEIVCTETCRYTFLISPDGYWLVTDSLFQSSEEFAFGDQEEMGLGIRVATAISVKSGGQMRDADGRVNEKAIWGKSSAWCDYSGRIDGHHVGMMIAADPANFRPSRYHARDYGLLTANPFGQKVFREPDRSHVVVKAGEPFRLRFGILLHSTKDKEPDLAAAYREFLKRLSELPRP